MVGNNVSDFKEYGESGVGIELVDFEDLFNKGRTQKVIVNDLSNATLEDRIDIERLLFTRYESSEFLSNIPSCECGKSRGEYLMYAVCSHCGTHVVNSLEEEVEPLLWIRSPNEVSPLIVPNVLTMLSARFKLKGLDVIQWFCDRSYQPPGRAPAELENIRAMCAHLKVERGYNNFVDNFDAIFNGLLQLKVFRKPPKAKQKEAADLIQMVQQFRKRLFTPVLPIINRALNVIEDTNLGIYVDPLTVGANDAIQTMINIDSPLSHHSLKVKENRTFKTLKTLAEAYDKMYADRLAPKEGWFRKHVFGSRAYWSGRAVISSLTDPCYRYDEIHIPWGIAVSVLSVHVTNKLLKRNWLPRDIKKLLYDYAQKYHPLLDEIFKELIEESPWPGIPVILQRNPSLERGSAQAVFITKVKGSQDHPEDAEIPTISMHILIVVGFNADYDGDQLNFTLSIDNMTTEALERLAPHMSTFGLDNVWEISRNLSIPKTVISTIANWLHWPDEPLTPEQQAMMDAIPEAP